MVVDILGCLINLPLAFIQTVQISSWILQFLHKLCYILCAIIIHVSSTIIIANIILTLIVSKFGLNG